MDCNEVLDQVIKALLVTVVPAVVAWLCSWVREWAKAHVSNENLKAFLMEVDDTVAYLKQQLSDPWKAAAADGKLTEAEKAQLKERAVEILKERLKHLPERFLTKERIEAAIEAAVGRNKPTVDPQKPTTVTAPASQSWDQQTK